MREILFRVYCRVQNRMIYDFSGSKMYKIYQKEDNEIFVGGFMPNGDWNEPPIMQYTGLKDKNGKKIFEGDILKVNSKHGFHGDLLEEFKELKNLDTINGVGLHFTGIVRIDFLRGLMFENPKNGYQEPMFSRKIDISRYHSGIEIIGNIHQNPELI